MPDADPRLMTIFGEALEMSDPAARAAYLDRVCGEDAELRQRVEALLAAHTRAGRFLEPDLTGVVEPLPFISPDASHSPSPNPITDTVTRPPAGSQTVTLPPALSEHVTNGPLGSVRYFGDYELLAEIARGGMGIVFRSRQVSLNREVALKMILAGHLASAGDVQRFRTEAEAAASLDHPNIVPIYEVGEHEGQHYFSMKLVVGSSLAQVMADRKWPVGSKEALQRSARLLIKVAQAVHHAHQRGILHRDLKPANILLDAAGEPHVSDFGLAKRVEGDSGQTRTGAIVGTPSYMPPEQALGKKGGITTAADVYSLGAILFELLTGRPPFRGETPLDTLRQVVEKEPDSPRRLNPRVHADLEAICLKCLEKDPRQRYGSAEALTEDLTSWLNDQPVKARRASPGERVKRWLWRRRRAVLLAATPVLLVICGFFGWQWWVNSRLGQVTLTADSPTLKAEVLDEQDQLIGKPFTVPTLEPVPLPEGNYRVRVSQAGQLSETFLLDVKRETRPQFPMGLEDRRLWDPIPVPMTFDVVDLGGGHADMILTTDKGLRRLDGGTAKQIWSVEQITLTKESEPGPPLALGNFWQSIFQVRSGGFPLLATRPVLVQPAQDLDGDGTPDLVWASPNHPSLVAVSGRTGKILWWFIGKDFEGQRLPGLLPTGAVMGQPVVANLNGDGTPVIVANFALQELDHVSLWIEAVSGRDGTSIWRHRLPSLGLGIAINEQPPCAMAFAGSGKDRILTTAIGSTLTGLDFQTGEPVWPEFSLGADIRRVQFADLGGVGQPDSLLVEKGPNDKLYLEAISVQSRQPLWQISLRTCKENWSSSLLPKQEPVVATLSRQGKPQVIAIHKHFGNRTWAEIEVLDGLTGEIAWRRMLPVERELQGQAYERLIIGPDIDGDGIRDVFVATLLHQDGWNAFVDALSGKDGRSLWKWSTPHRFFGNRELNVLRWWQAGADGWPQLVVPSTESHHIQPSETYIISTGSGQLAHLIPDAPEWHGSVDLDGDGIPDLIGLHQGKLQTIRGAPPEAWRRLGMFQPAADFDGDGIPDLVTSSRGGPGWVSAVSGRDGRVLWSSGVQGQLANGPSQESPGLMDLDGDGVPDLIVFQRSGSLESKASVQPLQAISGKTGRVLWKIDDLRERRGDWINEWHFLECRYLDGNREPDVLFAYTLGNNDSTKSQLWLAVIAGKDGRIKWKTPLSPEGRHTLYSPFKPVLLDRRGDEVLDLVVWAINSAGAYEVRALNSQDGKLLWQTPLDYRPEVGPPRHPKLAIHNEKGSAGPQVVVAFLHGTNELHVTVLDGLDGKTKRQWKFPERVYLQDMLLANGVVCAVVTDKTNETGLDIYDSQGEKRGRIHPVDTNSPIWSSDLAADGKEELVFISKGKVRAVRGTGQSYWKHDWTVPGGEGQIVALEPAIGPERPALIVVQAGRDVYGIDGLTGQLRWRCEGPGKFGGLLAENAFVPPRVVFHTPDRPNAIMHNTVCRNALVLDGNGRCLPPEGIARPYDPIPAESDYSESALSLRQVAIGNLLLIFMAVVSGLYSWGQVKPGHSLLRRICCWTAFGLVGVAVAIMFLSAAANLVPALLLVAESILRMHLFDEGGLLHGYIFSPEFKLHGGINLLSLIVPVLVGCLPWRKENVHFRIARGYYLAVLAGLTVLASTRDKLAAPFTGVLFGIMALAVVLPSLVLLWNPRRLWWTLLVLVIATSTAWGFVLARLATDSSDWRYTPLSERCSLWFIAAYAVALLTVATRVVRCLGRVMHGALSAKPT